jgi:hypothetical protein
LTFGVPGLLAAALPVGLRLGPVRMRAAVTEDHLVEWLQVGLLAGAAVLLLRCWRVVRVLEARRVDARVYGLLAIATLFVALEEISWGQRILGFETPHGLSRVNQQGEFNLHNYAWFHIVRNWLPLAFSAVGALCAWRSWRNPPTTPSTAWSRLLPGREMLFTLLACLAVSVWLLLLYLTALRQEDDWRVGRVVAEWAELMVAYVLFLYAWLRAVRLEATRSGA